MGRLQAGFVCCCKGNRFFSSVQSPNVRSAQYLVRRMLGGCIRGGKMEGSGNVRMHTI